MQNSKIRAKNKTEKQQCQPPFTQQPWSYLACSHEEGEDEDEGALGNRQPVSLLQGEKDGSVQTGFGRAAETKHKLSVKHVTAAEIKITMRWGLDQNQRWKIKVTTYLKHHIIYGVKVATSPDQHTSLWHMLWVWKPTIVLLFLHFLFSWMFRFKLKRSSVVEQINIGFKTPPIKS